MSENKVVIFCDGACSGNQFNSNKGGWGAVVKTADSTEQIHGGERNTTNQRMELLACIKALELIAGTDAEIEINSDSAYLVNCIHQKWYAKWQKNGWKTSKNQPVENQDLWKNLLELVSRHNVKFKKVSGHSGVELNELADGLAKRGISDL